LAVAFHAEAIGSALGSKGGQLREFARLYQR
jgi:hypothetical protein